jgi:predicted ABC-type ATPase
VRKPWFVLVGGINGAGKSTFSQSPVTLVRLVRLSKAAEIRVINPDTVTRAIVAEYPRMKLADANKRAAEQCIEDVKSTLERRREHFLIETVLSTDKYQPIVERALTLGWQFLFVYVALRTVDEAILRVASRVSHGGHDVPTAKVRSRWPRSLERMPWFWKRATAAALFLNESNFESPKLLALKLRGWSRFSEGAECPHAVGPILAATAETCGVST